LTDFDAFMGEIEKEYGIHIEGDQRSKKWFQKYVQLLFEWNTGCRVYKADHPGYPGAIGIP
jgi:hypothetical protein